MIVMAVDPALRNTGIVIIDTETDSILHAEVLETTEDKMATKSNCLMGQIIEIGQRLLILKCKYGVDVTVGEAPIGAATGMIAMRDLGMVLGMCALWKVYNYNTIWVTPFDVKEAATGDKRGAKAEIIATVLTYYNDFNWQAAICSTCRKRDSCRARDKDKCWLKKMEHCADAVAAWWASKEYLSTIGM